MNFRGILSKSSLRSSSSGKSLTHSEEVSKLRSEIESLKQTIDSLKLSVENRDAAIGTLAREKEKIYVEFKSAQRTNRNLYQQLVDERVIHSKEKEFFVNVRKRLSKRGEHDIDDPQNEDGNKVQIKNLFDELKAKDEVIYNIGAKYMKIKSNKGTLQKKLIKIQEQNKKTCENIILLLQDNRKTLDNILDNLLKSFKILPDCKDYLNLLQINANLHYENTQLKINQYAKDTEILRQELSSLEVSEQSGFNDKYGKPASKAEVKLSNLNKIITIGRHRNNHSKLRSFTDYYCTHRTFSSKYENALFRSLSDSCIVISK